MIFADVNLTTEGIVLISGLSATLTGAIYGLYRLLIANYDLRLKGMETQYQSQLVAMEAQYKAQLAMISAQYDAQIKDLKEQRKSYQEIADESTKALEAKVNEVRGKKGKPPTVRVADVVPEHNSPVTPLQQETADLQTMRARLTAATLELGLPPREAGPPQKDPPAPSLPADPKDTIGRLEKVAAIHEIAADKQKEAAEQQETTAAKLDETLRKHDEKKQ